MRIKKYAHSFNRLQKIKIDLNKKEVIFFYNSTGKINVIKLSDKKIISVLNFIQKLNNSKLYSVHYSEYANSYIINYMNK